MIVILHLLISSLLTYIYAILVIDFSNWLLVLSLLGVFVFINVLTVVLIVLFFYIMVLLTKHINTKLVWKHRLYMAFSNYLFFFVFRVKVIVKGLENMPKDHNFVVYSNHIEYNDPLYIKKFYYDFALAYISKEPLFKYPLVKDVLVGTGCIPIGKMADRESLQSILKAIQQVKSGQPMGIFPEGKRSYSNNMNPFRPGAFKVASKAKADISLVALYDFHKINVNKIRIRKVKVYLSILPIIKYEDYKDLDTVKISQLAYKKIDDELNEYKKLDNK